MRTVKGRVLIDTNVLIYATLEDDPRFARAKIQAIASLPTPQVLPLTGDVQSIALELFKKNGITRQRYYDAQLAA